MGNTDLQNLFWQFLIFLESEGRFQRLCSPHYTFTFCRMGFCIFQMFLLLYRMPVMCLELQKIRHFRCLPLSSVTWSFSINFCLQTVKVLFSDGKSLLSLVPLFLLQFQNNTVSLYVEQQEFHSLLYSPHHNHQCPTHQRAMIFCVVIFLPGSLSNENETVHISPCLQLYQPTRCSNFSSLLLVV